MFSIQANGTLCMFDKYRRRGYKYKVQRNRKITDISLTGWVCAEWLIVGLSFQIHYLKHSGPLEPLRWNIFLFYKYVV